ncbi:MAG: SAM-dependent methyltransferase, partial [Clostridia bacterium]|nr:SAM-dependent methyltransferase [Clostridia bacterium]
MTKGTTKNKGQKDIFDRFYTKEEVAKKCISFIKNIEDFNIIIEPAAGRGSFSSNINNCLAFDIEPKAPNIIKADWFSIDKNKFLKPNNKILIVGNPPFGQQNSIAIKFFNESSKIADTIAFILPKSFKKDSIKNRLNLNFHLIFEKELEEKSFEFQNKEVSIPCIFQIWKKQNTPRTKVRLKTTTKYFDFVDDKTKADFRIQRVGGNAGKASFDLNRAKSSNYFIKNNSNL